jgi:hypothetical protein
MNKDVKTKEALFITRALQLSPTNIKYYAPSRFTGGGYTDLFHVKSSNCANYMCYLLR